MWVQPGEHEEGDTFEDAMERLKRDVVEPTLEQRRLHEAALEKDVPAWHQWWLSKAKARDFTSVAPPLTVFEHLHGDAVKENPRTQETYVGEVLRVLGFRAEDHAKHPELSAEEFELARDLVKRKAGAFWVEQTPRTTLRGFEHDVITVGPPVRGPRIRLNEADRAFVADEVRKEEVRGHVIRGNSP